jgi:CxxC motif-containing protein (DUF1111 family)
MSQYLSTSVQRSWRFVSRNKVSLSIGALLLLSGTGAVVAQNPAKDPGVRAGSVDSGLELASVIGAPPDEYFLDGKSRFQAVESVQGGLNNGLGPRFNSNSCSSCHAQPTIGGSSPSTTAFPFVGPNPEMLVTAENPTQNPFPSFLTIDGPAREARFKFFLNRDGSANQNMPDGGVHDLFVISGRPDAGSCSISQPDFAHNLKIGNVIFRIPTPVFGAGLIENIPDENILANMNTNAQLKNAMGISGHPNRSGNDGTITRFGWKAQNKSLEMFAGEAYNVEEGITNELFMNERASPDEAGLPAHCRINPTPEDATNMSAIQTTGVPSDIIEFAMFMRLLAPPTPSTTTPGGAQSITNGQHLFSQIGCALCHTPTMQTGASAFTPSLSNANANLYSDLLVHNMGNNLADGVSQGGAAGDEFRTAPLWGLGQRVFFLHDGRSTDLIDTINQHAGRGSEANGVVQLFQHRLNQQQQQDLLNFLRSL